MKKTVLTLAFLAWMFTVPTGWAQKSDDAEHAELAKARRDAKISLQRELSAITKVDLQGKSPGGLVAKGEVGVRVMVSEQPGVPNEPVPPWPLPQPPRRKQPSR